MRKKDVYVVILNSKFKEDDESEDIQVNWRVQNKYLGVLNFNFRKMIIKRMKIFILFINFFIFSKKLLFKNKVSYNIIILQFI
jgi:hypothetical protein